MNAIWPKKKTERTFFGAHFHCAHFVHILSKILFHWLSLGHDGDESRKFSTLLLLLQLKLCSLCANLCINGVKSLPHAIQMMFLWLKQRQQTLKLRLQNTQPNSVRKETIKNGSRRISISNAFTFFLSSYCFVAGCSDVLDIFGNAHITLEVKWILFRATKKETAATTA